MKKFLLSLLLIITFGFYVLSRRVTDDANEVRVVAPSMLPQAQSSGSDQPIPSAPAVSSAAPISNLGQYKDGSYTGDVTDAFYGNIQVKATINGGKITDVQFLQYPNDRRTSVEINQQAMPFLKQEAIQAQSASVDIVSGATQSSEAFVKSLQSALDKAKG